MQPDLKISNDVSKQTESFFDWDQTVNKENIINNSYFGDESFNFIDEDDDINNKILKEAKNLNVFKEEEKSNVIPISDGMLKYIGFMDLFEGIGGNKNIPLKRPSDRIEINKLFKKQTGYTFQAFLNNDIPMKAIETPEFQLGLDNMYKFYEDKGFTVKIPERTNLTQFEQTLKGLGVEIGGGFGLDYATKNLLGAGPWGIAAYVSINALGGGYLNYLSQEARFGQQGFIGQKDKFKWGELIGASGVQTIPFGVTDKGFKGIGKSFAFGGSLTGAETTIRNLIDEKEFPTFKEYLLSIGLGGTFAAIFKSGLETFDGLVTKYKGKSPKEISELITDKEVKDLNKFADNTVTLQKQLQQQPQAKVNKNNQNLGDPDFTPNQINPKQVSNTNRQFDLIANRVRELKDQGAFRGVKTFEDTIDGGIKLLANKKKLKRYAETYAKLYGLQPTDELNYALAESITFSVRRTSEINQDLINAINVSKDNQLIETKINELVDSIAEIDDWLRLSIPLRTEAATALSSMRIPTQGLSAEEFAKLTPQAKYRLENTGQTELSVDISDQSLKLQDLKKNLLSALETAKETGDYSAINKLTNTIKQSQIGGDSVETLSALYRSGILDRTLSSFNKGMRVFNEIGINALLSAPSTNEVNFVSGVLETYTSAFELMLGAGNRTELDAAIRHFIKLHSDLSFSTKAFKKSWEMSDNYVNRGSLKADYQERFIISSDDPGFVGKSIDTTGKVIRLPSRLMTSVDALVQSPNLIGHIHYQGHIEGVQLGKKGKDLDNYIKGHLDAILEYYASNSGKAIKDPVTKRILKRAQEFAKRSTFTEDIRTDGYIGFSKGANYLNKAANDIPLVRGLMAFVRTPFNITKRQLRRTPGLSYLQKQLQNDLQSIDPGVRNQARGQVRLATGLGLTLFTLGVASLVKPRDPNNPAGVILTGGGPDWKTKEGRAIWKNLYRNGWRPYSIGHLQRNEDGTPKFGEDGKPVYKYTSYERIDPLSTWIGLMVDFSHIAPWLKPDEYDEFTTGFVTAFSRNLIDRTYTRQIYEATETFYNEEKRGNFLARQLAARVPFANFIRYSKRMPDDILASLGVSEEDREFFNTKRDLKVRKGDIIDKEGEEIVGADIPIVGAKDLRKLLNQMSETVPGMGGDLPLMYEHITDEPMLYPERLGPDLFSFVKKSTSKNNPIYTALIETGIQIREPSDVITGKATDSQIEPFKLNTKEYAELRKEINTIIPESQEYGNKNIKEAMTAFINSKFYKDNIEVIRKNGILNSPVAVKLLTKEFNKINNYYITEGEDAWIKKQSADIRNKQRNKKLEIYNKYNEEIQKIRALSSN